MQFIRNDAVEEAFITMMNKLIYGHRKVLSSLLDNLRRVNEAPVDRYGRFPVLSAGAATGSSDAGCGEGWQAAED